MSTDMPEIEEISETDVDEEVAEPPNYKVLLHNDDFTTKMFVVQVLVTVFNKSEDEATSLMWHIHRNGTGVCGIYPYEIAETKVKTVTELAREFGFPLRTTMEPE